MSFLYYQIDTRIYIDQQNIKIILFAKMFDIFGRYDVLLKNSPDFLFILTHNNNN